MSQPVIFDIAYTPYRLKKGSSQADIDKHAKDRAFFDMSGRDNNIYKYMTAEGKIMGEETQKFTMLEYLQKSTGVFNQNGLLSKQEVKEMKKRVQSGEKNIWHGFKTLKRLTRLKSASTYLKERLTNFLKMPALTRTTSTLCVRFIWTRLNTYISTTFFGSERRKLRTSAPPVISIEPKEKFPWILY